MHDTPPLARADTDRGAGPGPQIRALKALWPYLWHPGRPDFKWRVLLSFILIFLAQVITIAAPLLLEEAINLLSSDPAPANAIIVALALVAGYGIARLLGGALPQLREYLFAPVSQHTQRAVAGQIFTHLHGLSLRYHLERRTGGLAREIERGVRAIDFLFRFLVFSIGPTLIQLVLVALLFGLRYSPIYALIAALTVIAYFWFTISSTEWRLKFRKEMNDRNQTANTHAVDSLLNFETVKYFTNERFENDRYDATLRQYHEAALKSNSSLVLLNIGQVAIFTFGLSVILALTAYDIAQGRLGIGALAAISLIMMNLNQPLNILGFAYREIKQALVDMERMFALLGIQPEITDVPDAPKLAVTRGEVVFENVDFAYEDRRPILRDISFTARPGETIAIVGPSGAGKSTIARILFRFYDVTAGRILIDGHCVASVSQDSLRRAIGVVPQDTVLFNDTIGYNIGYADPGAGIDDIKAAARRAQIHDFIESLPDGYDSLVGERGLKLSGGEKQRVAIARTILKNPPVLILDEATSALDSTTEAEIQTALSRIAHDRTTLVIAHRLSTITAADQILVMDHGQITERGTHSSLLALGGHYAQLWHQQEKDAGQL